MLSTHILDLHSGMPASGIQVQLEKANAQSWESLETAGTNQDGRISFQAKLKPGSYRLVFQVASYFKTHNQETFYSTIPVEFAILDINRKYHVPLLLSPFGYSTYRGS